MHKEKVLRLGRTVQTNDEHLSMHSPIENGTNSPIAYWYLLGIL